METYACNYALVRFAPYRETGEFANIGVALTCAKTGYLDFRVERKRFARVTRFSPELALSGYREGVRALDAECRRWHELARHLQKRDVANSEHAEMMRRLFTELTRTRESVFHFDAPRTVLSNDPAAKLDELFAYYVRRQFLTEEAHGEEAMRQKIAESLKSLEVAGSFLAARIGTEDYSVKFPFVAGSANEKRNEADEAPVSDARKAIKPFNLDRRDSSEIMQHGDDWAARLRRLQKLDALPEHVLFAINKPAAGRALDAAEEICRELRGLGVSLIEIDNRRALEDFVSIR